MGTSSILKGLEVELTSMVRKLWRMYRQTRTNQISDPHNSDNKDSSRTRIKTYSSVYKYQRWEEFFSPSIFSVVPCPQIVISQEDL